MLTSKACSKLITSAALSAALILAVASVEAQTETILHSFANNNGKDGTNPCAALVFDSAGNLYGTTTAGGVKGDGTAFELMPKAGGGWTEVGLHTFGNGSDGLYPYGNLIFDASGNLYGTTDQGGVYGLGTVFELSPKIGGGWTEKVLHSFGLDNDGWYPNGGLIFDSTGNLYGTAESGGTDKAGMVFKLSPAAGGRWTETALHNFGRGKDGAEPVGNLIFDGSGNLYGAAYFGGDEGKGMIFELSPKADGGWAESELHSFTGQPTDGYLPTGSLIFDSAGNLYGLTYKGGPDDLGTVFELTKGAGGIWTSSILHGFENNGVDGNYPEGNLIMDSSGNLYGTASAGGSNNDGVVYEMSPEGGQSWLEDRLFSFNGTDGQVPCSGLIFDSSGNLYGTTLLGGAQNGGTVFELTP